MDKPAGRTELIRLYGSADQVLVEFTNEISEQQFATIFDKLVKRINEQEIEKRLRSKILRELKNDYLILPPGATMEQAEEEIIRQTLDICQGNRSKAAAKLGLGRKTLHRKMSAYATEIR